VSSEREPDEPARGGARDAQLALDLTNRLTNRVAAETGEWIDFGRAAAPDRVVCGDAQDELGALGDGVIDAIYVDQLCKFSADELRMRRRRGGAIGVDGIKQIREALASIGRTLRGEVLAMACGGGGDEDECGGDSDSEI